MESIRQQVANIAKEIVLKTPSNSIANVYNVDCENMVCDIIMPNPLGPGEKLFYNVPIQIGSGGMSQAGPFVGDRVAITFQNGTMQSAVITAVLDRKHDKGTREQRLRHRRKGAYLTDKIVNRTYWPIGED